MTSRSEYGAFTRIALEIIASAPHGLTANQIADQALEIGKARGLVLTEAKEPRRSLASTVHRQYTYDYLPGVTRRMGTRGEYIYRPDVR